VENDPQKRFECIKRELEIRQETQKRDPQKRYTKETHKRDPQKRFECIKRELEIRQETQKRDPQKRPIKETHKRDPQKKPTKHI